MAKHFVENERDKKGGTFCKNHDDGIASLRLFSVESRCIFYVVVSAWTISGEKFCSSQ